MSTEEIEAAAEELISILETLTASLRELGQNHWADWVEQSNRHLKNRDLYGVDYLLRAYGGMGSLNDIAAPPIAGLKSKAWELATYIQRNSN